jgi:hypothetical protein
MKDRRVALEGLGTYGILVDLHENVVSLASDYHQPLLFGLGTFCGS